MCCCLLITRLPEAPKEINVLLQKRLHETTESSLNHIQLLRNIGLLTCSSLVREKFALGIQENIRFAYLKFQ